MAKKKREQQEQLIERRKEAREECNETVHRESLEERERTNNLLPFPMGNERKMADMKSG